MRPGRYLSQRGQRTCRGSAALPEGAIAIARIPNTILMGIILALLGLTLVLLRGAQLAAYGLPMPFFAELQALELPAGIEFYGEVRTATDQAIFWGGVGLLVVAVLPILTTMLAAVFYPSYGDIAVREEDYTIPPRPKRITVLMIIAVLNLLGTLGLIVLYLPIISVIFQVVPSLWVILIGLWVLFGFGQILGIIMAWFGMQGARTLIFAAFIIGSIYDLVLRLLIFTAVIPLPLDAIAAATGLPLPPQDEIITGDFLDAVPPLLYALVQFVIGLMIYIIVYLTRKPEMWFRYVWAADDKARREAVRQKQQNV
ncbi:MAG: hypothetical protein HC893_07345 [Chloroflexaceae bacterium]|nr:hypothetical protein [Chloroflexaceae bacterium]